MANKLLRRTELTRYLANTYVVLINVNSEFYLKILK